jgi:hypothetical protein
LRLAELFLHGLQTLLGDLPARAKQTDMISHITPSPTIGSHPAACKLQIYMHWQHRYANGRHRGAMWMSLHAIACVGCREAAWRARRMHSHTRGAQPWPGRAAGCLHRYTVKTVSNQHGARDNKALHRSPSSVVMHACHVTTLHVLPWVPAALALSQPPLA